MAIKVAGTTVVDDSRVLQNVTGLKTLSGISVLGSGDIQSVNTISGTAIDCSTGVYFTKTVNGSISFTFSNVPTSVAYTCVVEITHTSGTIGWPLSVVWPGDTAPTLTTGKTHLFVFITDDGGTRWRGASITNYTN